MVVQGRRLHLIGTLSYLRRSTKRSQFRQQQRFEGHRTSTLDEQTIPDLVSNAAMDFCPYKKVWDNNNKIALRNERRRPSATISKISLLCRRWFAPDSKHVLLLVLRQSYYSSIHRNLTLPLRPSHHTSVVLHTVSKSTQCTLPLVSMIR